MPQGFSGSKNIKVIDVKINVGILGCGNIARTHADSLKKIENAVLRGVADTNAESCKAFADAYGTTAYQSYDAMLADESIDIVSICVPSGFHEQSAIKALKAGKHVIVEKPMAITTEGCDAIIRASEDSGCMVTVISQLRFSDNIKRIKALLDEGRFGKILSADLSMKYWRDPAYFSQSSWRGTKSVDGGGALMNQGIHGVDLLVHLLGEPRLVGAKSKTLYHDIEVEDLSMAVVEFENGALGSIHASTCLSPGFSRKLKIYGTNGYVVICEDSIEELMLDGKLIELDSQEVTNQDSARSHVLTQTDLHVCQISNMVNAVVGKEELYIGVKEGKKAVKLICDIYKL